MCPDKHFILLDSLGKRVRFMKQVAHDLGINNIQPVQSRVEDFTPEQPLYGVLSRAFASLHDMLDWCKHLIDQQGEFLALKGIVPHQEIEQLSAEFVLDQVIELQVPNLEGQRHIVKIKKADYSD
jgi:16S rRNA (guanine527-N7)-methyltransferase